MASVSADWLENASIKLALMRESGNDGLMENLGLMLFLSGNGITGGDSRLREQMQAALPAPGCYATPCQSGYFFALLRLAIIGLID